MSARKSSHRTIFLIVSSGSPLALIASSLRSISKKPVCPMTRSFHPPMVHCNQRVRFAATWREEFFEVPFRKLYGRFLRAISCASATPADAQPSRAAANQQGAAFFVVRCSLPCDPPAGGHSCNGGIIPRFHRAVWERPMGRSSQCFRLTAVEAALNGEGRIYKAADMGRCQALRFWVRQRPLVVGLRWLGADLVVGP